MENAFPFSPITVQYMTSENRYVYIQCILDSIQSDGQFAGYYKGSCGYYGIVRFIRSTSRDVIAWWVVLDKQDDDIAGIVTMASRHGIALVSRGSILRTVNPLTWKGIRAVYALLDKIYAGEKKQTDE